MKKLLSFMLMTMLAISASAVSITWKSGTAKFGTTSLGSNGTGFLVFIGDTSLSSLTPLDIIGMTAQASSATKVGKMNVPDTDLGNSPVGNWAMYLTYVDEGKTYYNVSSSTYTLTQANLNALLSEGTALPVPDFQFTATIHDPNTTPLSSGTIGGGWYASVPEPATGALALAGVALLFRRRKA